MRVVERAGLKPGRLARIPVAFAVPAALLFGAAGTWRWPEAWVYLGLMLAGGAAAIAVFVWWQPELAEERTRWREGKDWDKPLVFVLAIAGPSVIQLVCGLDRRFHWSPALGAALQATGAALFVAGTAIVAWSMAVNRFFSAVVRIQTERGHVAIDSGPYRHVRHPGYAGMLIGTLAGPLLLDSLAGLVPATLVAIVIAVRTTLEDRTLQVELPGYAAYARRVRWKLVPLVW